MTEVNSGAAADPAAGPGVGIVVISHSRPLARAAVSLASEMLHGRPVRIEVAAGLDDSTFGTDAVRIKEAIERVDGPDGVVVLMDLGSAVLSAELALDLLEDPTGRDRVILSPAPLVEGLIVAVVAAAGGAARAEVASEARAALMGKAAHLTTTDQAVARGAGQPAAADQVVGVFRVANAHGLHARPAARLVSEVRGLDATVQLRNLTTGAGPVPASSLSRVATLAALSGHEVEVRASGPQAQEAVEHLLTLAVRRFDEPAEVADHPRSRSEQGARPLPASPGIAIGPVRRLSQVPVDLEQGGVGTPAVEWRRIVGAVAEVRREIEQIRAVTSREVGVQEASIFDAHVALLADAEMLGDVKQQINEGVGATAAWANCVAGVEQQWADLPDPYLRERAEDVRAVGDQVLRALTGASPRQPTAQGILVARDLTPAEAAELDADLVRGIVLADGSPSSHAVILARARDIPAVVGAGSVVLSLAEGTTIVFDGGSGELYADPSAELLETFRRRAAGLADLRAHQLARADQPVETRDGTPFVVAANLGSVADARAALAAGADAAGLVRTEFLFLGRDSAPSVEEQQAEYDAIAEAMTGRRVTLRTLDVGGDKPLPYLPMVGEQNPFLGRRGIRLSLENRELLGDQLRAVCETARRHPTSVMFPMVTTVGELLEARRALADAAGTQGLPAGLQVGMMVEVPGAALKIETFLEHLDFVSIGTNDLTQYTLAAERGNGAVAAISDALDPSVLQLVDRVCRAALGRVSVAVCGEAASDELAIPILAGLGVRELSVTPAAVPRVKAAIRGLDLSECTALARLALRSAGPDAVRRLVLSSLSARSA